jgi:hypothetical protein
LTMLPRDSMPTSLPCMSTTGNRLIFLDRSNLQGKVTSCYKELEQVSKF